MKLLLDTHIFLWLLLGDSKLPRRTLEAIRDAGNQVSLSVASVWEVSIKQQSGKFELPEPAGTYLPTQRAAHFITELPVLERHVAHLGKLPPIHRDPFDRIMVCQAIEHEMTLVTVDRVFQQYPVKLF